jgi:HK97 family phage major capsid protein
MKVNVMDFFDTKNMSEEDVKKMEGLAECVNTVVENKLKSFLSDEIKLEDLKKEISEAVKSVEGLQTMSAKALDKETYEKGMQEVNNALLRIKAATEVKNGQIEVKSIEAQLHDQLKDYIVTDAKGMKTLNLQEACKSNTSGKFTVDLVVKDAGVIVSGSNTHFGAALDNQVVGVPRAESVIRKYASVAPTQSRSLVYADYVSKDGDAAWVPEGGLKPLMDAELQEKTVTAGKVAIVAKFTEETLADYPAFVAEVQNEMVNKIGIKEENGILNGSGTGGEIKGVAVDMPAFALDGLEVEKGNEFDAIVAAYTQVVATSEMNYRPNLVLLNPVDYAKMQLTKDANGGYLRPFQYNGELVPGMRVEATNRVAKGSFILGDFGYLNIRDLQNVTITFGWENDDFRKNIVTCIAEKRLMAYLKSQYKTAFVKDTFANVITAITA